MRRPIYVIAFALMIAGCSLLGKGDDGPGDLTLEELRAAPTSIVVGGRTLVLATYMWRDFMPISPPNGKALIALFQIETADASPLPDGLTSDAAWVVNDTKVWDTFFEDEDLSRPFPHRLERIARNGPKWGPHIEVEAVVRIIESDGTTHFLRAANQTIHRTD